MPAWGETALRLASIIIGVILTAYGHPVAGVGAIGAGAGGDLPFRATSTGASSGRKEEARAAAEQVVIENVEPAAIQPTAPLKG